MSINLICGDCYEKIKQIEKKSIDLIITDPPYDLNISTREIKKTQSRLTKSKLQNTNSLNFIKNGIDFDYVKTLLIDYCKKPNGYFFCNKSQILGYLKLVEELNINFEILTLYKYNSIPAINYNFRPDVEYCIYLFKNINLQGDATDRSHVFISNINDIQKERKLWKHPTIKPLSFIKRLIKISSKKGDVILDPFMGSGTTGVGAVNLKRDFIGIELSEEYFSIAKERIENANSDNILFDRQYDLFDLDK